MRRKRWIVVEAVGLSGLLFPALYLGRPYPPGSGVHWSNLDRIVNGMSRKKAVAVIGPEP